MTPPFKALCLAAVASAWSAGVAAAFEPALPAGARLTAERASALDGFDAPTGPFDGRIVPTLSVEGAIMRRAWRIETGGLTPLQVMIPLRQQLGAAGYDVIFECEASACGGFDFRFNTEVLPGPNMYVNISRYRYLTALRGRRDAPGEIVGVLVSVTAASAYVQIIAAHTEADIADVVPQTVEAPLAPVPPAAPAYAEFERVLLAEGRVILSDLDFATGTTDLGRGPYVSLAELVATLTRRPGLRVALVGHTDTVGDLETNIALSRARAASVRDRLISEFGVDPARLDAEGMGYLSPIASNLTDAGRAENRRVEVIVLREN